MNKKTYRWVILVLVLAMVAAACGDDDTSATDVTSAPDASGPKRGGILTIAHFVGPSGLDPSQNNGFEGDFMSLNIREGLTQLDADGNVEGSLAVSWDLPDPLTYIFHLREGVTFHDGTDFSAADVKYTFDSLIDAEIHTYAALYEPFIVSTDIIDDFTVQVNLKIPWFGFLDNMARISNTRIIPEGYLDGEVDPLTQIGTGPYRMKNWIKGEELRLERYPDYWNPDEAFVDEIVFKIVPDAQTQLVQIQAGQVDLIFSVPTSAVDSLVADPNVTVNSGGSGKAQELLLNSLHPPFDNVNVRRGLLMIVDRQEVIDLGAAGFGVVPLDLFPSYMAEHNPDLNWDVMDVDGGVALLAAEGFTTDNPLEFELRTINTNFFIDQATVLKQQFEATGVIKIDVTPMEKAAFLAPLFRQEDPLQWQAALEMYSFTIDPTSFYWEQFAVDSYINTANVNLPGGYELPELEEVVDAARIAPTLEAQSVFFARELELIKEHALQLRIAYFDTVQAFGPDVRNFDTFVGNEYPLRLVWLDR